MKNFFGLYILGKNDGQEVARIEKGTSAIINEKNRDGNYLIDVLAQRVMRLKYTSNGITSRYWKGFKEGYHTERGKYKKIDENNFYDYEQDRLENVIKQATKT